MGRRTRDQYKPDLWLGTTMNREENKCHLGKHVIRPSNPKFNQMTDHQALPMAVRLLIYFLPELVWAQKWKVGDREGGQLKVKCISGPKREQLGNIKTWKLRQETKRFGLFCLIMHHAHPLTEVLMGKKWLQLNYPLGDIRG